MTLIFYEQLKHTRFPVDRGIITKTVINAHHFNQSVSSSATLRYELQKQTVKKIARWKAKQVSRPSFPLADSSLFVNTAQSY